MKKLMFAVILSTMSSAVLAAPVTFFGEDTSTAGIALGTNSQNARDDFLSNLVAGIGNENFEGFANGQTAPLNLTFPGSTGNLTATLSGGNARISQSGPGRFATSGVNFVQATSGTFRIDFGTEVSAFGFNGIDIGDFVTSQMTLGLTNGGTLDITVPHSLNIANSANATLFWGFYDLTETYSSITFTNAGGGDVFGFDDMVVGDLGQISVPEPGTIALFGLGVLSLGLVRRRKSMI